MDKFTKVIIGIAVTALVLSVAAIGVAFGNKSGSVQKFIGAAGNMLAEDYLPYVMYNGGYNSAKPISTSDTLDVDGTFTADGAAVFNGAVTGIATSTLSTLTVSGATVLNGGLTMDSTAFTVANTSGNTSIGGTLAVTGAMTYKEAFTNIAATSTIATTTLTAANSGTTYNLSASGTTIILPAVTSTGAFFRFVVGGALDTGNVIIDSAEGDNIEGILSVAEAAVDCDAEDQINFVVDGENIGDYVELRSNGTNWLLGASAALTTAKITCTDPS